MLCVHSHSFLHFLFVDHLIACDHRSDKGGLDVVKLVHLNCKSKFRILEPLPAFRSKCARVLVICSGAHTHPALLSTKTPTHVRNIVLNILESLDQDLADLTPRRMLRHTTVQARLRQLLPGIREPLITDLHVSLSNRDHIRAFISIAKGSRFPMGTGWEGTSDRVMLSHRISF